MNTLFDINEEVIMQDSRSKVYSFAVAHKNDIHNLVLEFSRVPFASSLRELKEKENKETTSWVINNVSK
jgi:hypothetical protein